MGRYRKISILGMVLSVMLYIVLPIPTYASDINNSDTKAVVFLLDASGSMKTNDPQRYAIDSIAQLIYTLPSNYEVGFVAYNTEVCATQTLVGNEQRDQIMDVAMDVRYADYSNAGAGLEQAVALLETSQAAEKSIVMLSDGEFLMKNEDLTEQSHIAYQAAMDRAVQQEITIHVIGLGEDMESTENSIFQAASYTNGDIYYTPQALEIQAAIQSILTEQFGIKQMIAGIIDADGEKESITVELPFSHANTIRVLLTSDSPIRNVKTNFNANGAEQITGERYSLIAIDNPQSSQLELSFTGTEGKQVKIALIPEYRVVSKVDVSYEDKQPEEETAVYYDREARLNYTFYDADNKNIQLWTEEYFENGKIRIIIGEHIEETALKSGSLTTSKTVTEEFTGEARFDCTELPVNVLFVSPAKLELEEAPELPVPEPEPPYALYGILAVAVAGILAVVLLGKSKASADKKKEPASDGRPAPGKNSYIGKINIYITRAPSGYDIAPLSYDLFRLPSTKVISIAEMLESCGVKEVFEGADRIYLNSGQGRSIILTNQSDCCIMKSGEILMKQKSYQLFENSKVDVTFEDEISELTFQYKVLKPSEMR